MGGNAVDLGQAEVVSARRLACTQMPLTGGTGTVLEWLSRRLRSMGVNGMLLDMNVMDNEGLAMFGSCGNVSVCSKPTLGTMGHLVAEDPAETASISVAAPTGVGPPVVP